MLKGTTTHSSSLYGSFKSKNKTVGEFIMPRMKNRDVIEAFVYHAKKAESHTGNLYISGDKLMNYATVLAQFIDGKFYVNSTKYSVTTSKIQTWIRCEVPSYIELTGVPINTYDLTNYVPQGVN